MMLSSSSSSSNNNMSRHSSVDDSDNSDNDERCNHLSLNHDVHPATTKPKQQQRLSGRPSVNEGPASSNTSITMGSTSSPQTPPITSNNEGNNVVDDGAEENGDHMVVEDRLHHNRSLARSLAKSFDAAAASSTDDDDVTDEDNNNNPTSESDQAINSCTTALAPLLSSSDHPPVVTSSASPPPPACFGSPTTIGTGIKLQQHDDKDATLVSLFGNSVGRCVTDVSASYFRVSGRLYLSTRAILFYSNIFGFERRLLLALSDVLLIESFRSTSVRITMIDCEDFVFKRIERRDSTLALFKDTLRQFKASEGGGRLPQMTGFITLVDSTTTSHMEQMEEDLHQRGPSNTEADGMLSSTEFLSLSNENCQHRADDPDEIPGFHRPRLSSEHTPEQDKDIDNELILSYPESEGQIESNFMSLQVSPTLVPSIAEYCPNRRRSLSTPTLRAYQTKFDFAQNRTREVDAPKAWSSPSPIPNPPSLQHQQPQEQTPTHRRSFPRAVSVPLESKKKPSHDGLGSSPDANISESSNGPHQNGRIVIPSTTAALTCKKPRNSQFLENERQSRLLPNRHHQPTHTGEALMAIDTEKPISDVRPTTTRRMWTEAKRIYSNVAVSPLTLSNCTLDDFFDLFLADNAPRALQRYQRDIVGDKDIKISKWEIDVDSSVAGATSTHRRKIKYLHPVKSAVGPSEAKTSRQQRLVRFEPFGMLLENTTEVAGIPMADCFKIIDQWVIEANDTTTPSLTLSVTFTINFIKRTMFKGIIQKSIQSETKEWFQGYISTLQDALREDKDLKSKVRLENESKVHLEVPQVESKDATMDHIEVTLEDSMKLVSNAGPKPLSSVVDTVGTILSGGKFTERNTSSSPNASPSSVDVHIDTILKLFIVLFLMMTMYQLTSIQRSMSGIEQHLQEMNVNTVILLRLLHAQETSPLTERLQ